MARCDRRDARAESAIDADRADQQVRDWLRKNRGDRLRAGIDVWASCMRGAASATTCRHRVGPSRYATHRRKLTAHWASCCAEVPRTLHAAGCETFAPIELVNWTNEEGSRFAPALTASGVFDRVFDRDWAHAREDRIGIRFGDALERIGYRGSERCGSREFSAFFELHIEQGPVLEREGKEIGVVTGVQGARWFECTLTGAEAHTGTAPMEGRKNALVGAARVIEGVDTIARAYPPLAVATVGLVEVKPNSRNVVPGEAFLTVDMRHPSADVLAAMEQKLVDTIANAAAALGLASSLKKIWDQAPVAFDDDCIACVRRAAASFDYPMRDIVSGAQHDAAYVSRVAPTAMIFVPCRDGISHNEAEFTSMDQCARGAQVLLQAVLDYDRQLAARHGRT